MPVKLLFIYGPPAAGKYTIARQVADLTGLPLFHNHLVVDAVMSVFPFGTPSFVALRDEFWLQVIGSAAREGRSLIFTFQPEASVPESFVSRVVDTVEAQGGQCIFARLTLSLDQQLQRIANADRSKFGKLRDPELLQSLHSQFERCEARMPAARVTIDTATVPVADAAARIAALV
jgi:hypothetical protein